MKEDLKELVSIETAKLAKEKGLDGNICSNYYDWNNNLKTINDYIMVQRMGYIFAPSVSILNRWLREKHHLLITIFSQSQESWQFHITQPHQRLEDTKLYEDYNSYDEAMNTALHEALLMINN